MRKTLASLEVLLPLLNVLVCDALCAQRFLSIDSTTLSYSGCYEETVYAGTYQTKVWTIDGGAIVSSGTKAIVADLVSSSGLVSQECASAGIVIFYSYLIVPSVDTPSFDFLDMTAQLGVLF